MRINRFKSTATFVRPNDTTPYAAKDSVCAAVTGLITFAGLGRALGQNGMIRSAFLFTNSMVTSNASFRLHLFSAAPAGGAIADNSPFDIFYVDAEKYLMSTDFGAGFFAETGGTGAALRWHNLTLATPLFADGDDIYGALEAIAAYVPIANQQFTLKLEVEN